MYVSPRRLHEGGKVWKAYKNRIMQEQLEEDQNRIRRDWHAFTLQHHLGKAMVACNGGSSLNVACNGGSSLNVASTIAVPHSTWDRRSQRRPTAGKELLHGSNENYLQHSGTRVGRDWRRGHGGPRWCRQGASWKEWRDTEEKPRPGGRRRALHSEKESLIRHSRTRRHIGHLQSLHYLKNKKVQEYKRQKKKKNFKNWDDA